MGDDRELQRGRLREQSRCALCNPRAAVDILDQYRQHIPRVHWGRQALAGSGGLLKWVAGPVREMSPGVQPAGMALCVSSWMSLVVRDSAHRERPLCSLPLPRSLCPLRARIAANRDIAHTRAWMPLEWFIWKRPRSASSALVDEFSASFPPSRRCRARVLNSRHGTHQPTGPNPSPSNPSDTHSSCLPATGPPIVDTATDSTLR